MSDGQTNRPTRPPQGFTSVRLVPWSALLGACSTTGYPPGYPLIPIPILVSILILVPKREWAPGLWGREPGPNRNKTRNQSHHVTGGIQGGRGPHTDRIPSMVRYLAVCVCFVLRLCYSVVPVLLHLCCGCVTFGVFCLVRGAFWGMLRVVLML